MKTIIPVLQLLLLLLMTGCGHHEHHHDEGKVTLLDISQVNKLAPYMVDLKKVGDLETSMDTVRLKDSTAVIQHHGKQSFTFRIMVDKDDHPVMPDSTAIVERMGGGGWHEGGVMVWCMGGCIMVNTQLCLLRGCIPMDNACGCIPPACGVCESWDCSSIVSGFVSGGVIMK